MEIKTHPERTNEKKDKILDQAEPLFANLGFEGVSTRLLAKEAGVNMAMLSYYFGSKEKLFESLIERRIEKNRAVLIEIATSRESPRQKIDRVIEYYVEKLVSNSNMHKIYTRELSFSQRKGAGDFICAHFMANMVEIGKVIKEGQALKVFREVDIELTVMTLFSLISQLVINPQYARNLLQIEEPDGPEGRAQLSKRTKRYLKDMLHTHLSFSEDHTPNEL